MGFLKTMREVREPTAPDVRRRVIEGSERIAENHEILARVGEAAACRGTGIRRLRGVIRAKYHRRIRRNALELAAEERTKLEEETTC